jgi:hypothetical protein
VIVFISLPVERKRIAVNRLKIKNIIPARLRARDNEYRSFIHPSNGPVSAKRSLMMKFLTERTVALIFESVTRLI